MFPKIIWQTHNYKKEWLPSHLNQVASTWKNLNPGWDYRYVDHIQRDEEVKKYPEIYEIYKYQPPAHQSDIWRYIVTYEHGGAYADMDSSCIRPLDTLLSHDAHMLLVPKVDGHGNNHNYLAKANSIPMSDVFDKMTNNPHSLIGWGTWDVFTETVYDHTNTLELFTMGDNGVAIHSRDYKDRFSIYSHRVNNINYIDFLTQNGLSASIL